MNRVAHDTVRPTLSLVVMEPGSDWPATIPESTDVLAFGQMHGEEQDELLRRMRDRVRAHARHGEKVACAILSCNESTSEEALSARVSTVRALVAALRRDGGERLMLVGRDGATAAQNAVRALAERLDGDAAALLSQAS